MLRNENYFLTDSLVRQGINVTNKNMKLENCYFSKTESGTDCLIKCRDGRMDLSNVTVEGDIQVMNGSINVTQAKRFSLSPLGAPALDVRAISTYNGDIRLARVRADRLQVENGRVELQRKSCIAGDVIVDHSRWFQIKNARIRGNLITSGRKLIIGCGARINRVIFKLDGNEGALRQHQTANNRVQAFGDDTPDCGAAALEPLNRRIPRQYAQPALRSQPIHPPRQRLAGPARAEKVPQPVEQRVELRDGAVLRELTFAAPRCILVLQGSACYKGDHAAVGLHVRREPSTVMP